MGLTTLIEWCHATVNFWWGCAKVSPGCARCYAEVLARIFGKGRCTWGPEGVRWIRGGEAVSELLKLERQAMKAGKRLRVFINSMSDTFEDRRDLDSSRALLFESVRAFAHLDFLILTKRPENVEALIPDDWKSNWPRNAWLGFTGENQEQFEKRWSDVEYLGRRYYIPVLFLSAEPLIGPLDLSIAIDNCGGYDGEPESRKLDWVIIGGESGAGARPMEIDWVRSIIKQLDAWEIPVFVKQLGSRWAKARNVGRERKTQTLHHSKGGELVEWPEDLRRRELPRDAA